MTVGTGDTGIGRYGDRRGNRTGSQHERAGGDSTHRSGNPHGKRCVNLAQIFLLFSASGKHPQLAKMTGRIAHGSP